MAAPPVPLVEFEFESLFVTEVLLLASESAVAWNTLEHAWHVGLELAVSSTVILQNHPQRNETFRIKM